MNTHNSTSSMCGGDVSRVSSSEDTNTWSVISAVSKCVIERTFDNVQQVYLSNLLASNATFFQTVTSDSTTSPPTTISLHPPHELHIEMTPNGNRHLYSTDDVVNRCSFICAPTATGDTCHQYETLNGVYAYDTPVNYLNHIDFRVHTLLDRLVYNKFGSNQCPRNNVQSPDVFHIQSITYTHSSNTLYIHLTETNLSRLQVRHLVSLMNLTIDELHKKLFNSHEYALYILLCTLYNQSYCVVQIDEESSSVYLNLDTLQLPISTLPLANAKIELNAKESLLLNESMQYTMVMQLKCLEKRLQQTF